MTSMAGYAHSPVGCNYELALLCSWVSIETQVRQIVYTEFSSQGVRVQAIPTGILSDATSKC